MSSSDIYINLKILNKDEIISSKVSEKAGTGFLGRTASYAASKLVTDEKISSTITSKLIEGIQKATDDIGITCVLVPVFIDGVASTIQLKIESFDTYEVIKNTKGEDFLSKIKDLEASVEALGMGDVVTEKVKNKVSDSVSDGIISKLTTIIPQKLNENGVKVNCCIKTSESQAGYFFNEFLPNI